MDYRLKKFAARLLAPALGLLLFIVIAAGFLSLFICAPMLMSTDMSYRQPVAQSDCGGLMRHPSACPMSWEQHTARVGSLFAAIVTPVYSYPSRVTLFDFC